MWEYRLGLSHLSELPIIENANDTIKSPEENLQELPFNADEQEQSQEITEETQPITEEIKTNIVDESEELSN